MTLPPPFNWLYDAWMAMSKAIGFVMSKIILTILWIIGFGIYGIIRRIIYLFVKKAEAPGTYWIDVPPTTTDDLHRQF